MSIIVVGSGAVGANALDEVVSIEADAVVVYETLVDATGGDDGERSGSGRHVGECACTVAEDVSRDAEARESGEIVCGVGGTDIAGRSDKEVALRAGTASVLVDLVSSAGGSGDGVGDAVTAYEVVAYDADTLAEDVVVDLIIGAGDGGGSGACGRRSVAGSGITSGH